MTAQLNIFKLKNCNKCNKNKTIEDFYKGRTECKECQKAYREQNREKVKEYKKAYWEQNREKIKAYREQNREKRKEWRKAYYEQNREKIKKRSKAYREQNREKVKGYKKAYREQNRSRLRIYFRNRYKTNINFKLGNNLRRRLLRALKGKSKSQNTLELLGCSVDFAKKHLENQFQPGMSWENYGFYGWHVDHIVPCASFDLIDPEQQKKCFHYSNLQPLWAEDNMSKKAKLNWKTPKK